MIRLEPFHNAHYAELISWMRDEEMLMQFGGPGFTWPLTAEQLDKSREDINRVSFAMVDDETKKHIGHGEIFLFGESAKLARIIIGDEAQRGKGIGMKVMHALIEYVKAHFGERRIELNVFDWNVAAIKCYEKIGFKINPDKKLERSINGKTWIAVNMILDSELWKENRKKKAVPF